MFNVAEYSKDLNVKNEEKKEGEQMPVHHGGKVGNAAKTLAKKNSSKKSKSKAGTILADHKAKKHK